MQKLAAVFRQFQRPLLGAVGVLIFIVAAMLCLANTTSIRAQSKAQSISPATPPPIYEYAVVSIKPSKYGAGGGGSSSADGFAFEGYSLKRLIESAYGVSSNQVLGAPDWMSSDQYDIEAKMDSAVAEALQKLDRKDLGLARQQMVQALLADRLKLSVHRETREFAVFSLIVSKKGPKFQEAKADETPSLDTTPRGETRIFSAKAMPIASLVRTLSSYLRCPVVDNTGLSGSYDFKLQWTPDETQSQAFLADASSSPSLISAVDEQLGLKLVTGKGPVGVIIVDHVERPSAN